MRVLNGLLGLLALGGIAGQASAQVIEQTQHIFRRPLYQSNGCYDAPASGPINVLPMDPKDKKDPIVDPEAFRQAPSAGSSAGQTFNPSMFGDLGASGTTTITVRSSSRSTFSSSYSSSSSSSTIRIPIVARGSFKISDNESPRPTDRIFFFYNQYQNVSSQDEKFNLYREMVGFETTLLDGNASFTMRLPFVQSSSPFGINGNTNNDIGDLTMALKYALINDPITGNVLSGGLALTVPLSRNGIPLADGTDLKTVLFQPFAGWIANNGNWWTHAFHAIVVPSDSRDVTILTNDIGIGYTFYTSPDRIIRAIAPTLEAHVFTPLDHRTTSSSSSSQIQAIDIVTMTAGLNFVLPGGSVLGLGVAAPVTGPRPNQVEGILAFNVRF